MIGPRTLNSPNTRVIIPVMMRAGKLVPAYGGELPKLREGAAIDLVTEEGDFLNREELERYNKEDFPEILPAGSEMFAVIAHRDQTFHRVADKIDVLPPPGGDTILIPFKLVEPLHLHLRGTRKAELMPCLCDLGIEGVEFPASVNQAYSRLSERYELWRGSHTGNVFTKVYYRVPDTDTARPLEYLRESNEAFAEHSLFYPPSRPPGRQDSANLPLE